jgi:DNA polymerase-3 subunit alpha
MKIAHHFSGLPMDECDVLRRIMSGKKYRSDKFSELQKRYYDGCAQRGHDPALSQEVWRQIESFAGYSFCKAHSASFAVESFQSLYLKVYFPLEFMVAVINNFGGFYRTEFYVHEARLMGAAIHPPCVNRSLYLTTITGKDVYLGFVHLQGLEQRLAHRIVHERARGGDYRDLADFVRRTDVSSEQLVLLIRIGALRFTGFNKYELMWERNAAMAPPARRRQQASGSGSLFSDRFEESYTLPRLREGKYDQAFDEIELLGFPLCSPFELLEETPAGTLCVRDFPRYRKTRIQVLGYFVTRKSLRTKRGEPMAFGTWLDTNGDYFDTTHFPGVWRHGELRAGGVYLITGKVSEDFGFLTIDAERVSRLAYVPDERYG